MKLHTLTSALILPILLAIALLTTLMPERWHYRKDGAIMVHSVTVMDTVAKCGSPNCPGHKGVYVEYTLRDNQQRVKRFFDKSSASDIRELEVVKECLSKGYAVKRVFISSCAIWWIVFFLMAMVILGVTTGTSDTTCTGTGDECDDCPIRGICFMHGWNSAVDGFMYFFDLNEEDEQQQDT